MRREKRHVAVDLVRAQQSDRSLSAHLEPALFMEADIDLPPMVPGPHVQWAIL